jgi:hypothetical protein
MKIKFLSDKSFYKTLKQFIKYSNKDIEKFNKKIEKYQMNITTAQIKNILYVDVFNKLYKAYKQNPYKSLVKYTFFINDIKITFSYNYEDINFKKCKNIDAAYLNFKIFIKNKEFNKMRIFRWRISLSYHTNFVNIEENNINGNI